MFETMIRFNILKKGVVRFYFLHEILRNSMTCALWKLMFAFLQALPAHCIRAHSTWCMRRRQTRDCVQHRRIVFWGVAGLWNFLVLHKPSDSYPALAASLVTLGLWRVWHIRGAIYVTVIPLFIWNMWETGMHRCQRQRTCNCYQ